MRREKKPAEKPAEPVQPPPPQQEDPVAPAVVDGPESIPVVAPEAEPAAEPDEPSTEPPVQTPDPVSGT